MLRLEHKIILRFPMRRIWLRPKLLNGNLLNSSSFITLMISIKEMNKVFRKMIPTKVCISLKTILIDLFSHKSRMKS